MTPLLESVLNLLPVDLDANKPVMHPKPFYCLSALLLFASLPGQATLVSMPLEDLTGNLLVNPGFEGPPPLALGLPTTTGVWTGDLASIVSAEQGISPRSGSKMLRHDAASLQPAARWNTGEMIQLIDLSHYAGVISNGETVGCASAYFNRVSGDSSTDTLFGIRLMAFNGTPDEFQDDPLGFTADMRSNIITDSDLETWESASVELLLPADTTYLAMWFLSNENVVNDPTFPEFDGHYTDDVAVTLKAPRAVPAGGPSLALSSAGLVLILLGARKYGATRS